MATTEPEIDAYVDPAAFARTYAARVYDDAFQAVEDYRAVMEYHRSQPDRGTRAVAREFDLPEGRVGAWLDGSRPNPVRGLDIAESKGWISPSLRGEPMTGLNVLVAWVSTRGSITTDTWTPFFVVHDDVDEQLLHTAAERAGVELKFSRSGHDDRTQELRPVEAGTVLGRVLHLLGAPRGQKTASDGPSLPPYLADGPDALPRSFVQVLLYNLGGDENDRYYLEFGSQYPTGYIDAVASLIERLTDRPASVLGRNVVLSRQASEAVAAWEPLLGVDSSR